jgi:hypothetical protein
MGTFITKQTKLTRDRDMIAGLCIHFANSEKLRLDGERYTAEELRAILEKRIAASEAVVVAKAALANAITRERESTSKTERLVSALRQALHLMFGKDIPALNDFGITPHKERRLLSTEEKLEVVAKILSTRAARHTMGKRQKMRIIGDASPVVVVTSRTTEPRICAYAGDTTPR